MIMYRAVPARVHIQNVSPATLHVVCGVAVVLVSISQRQRMSPLTPRLDGGAYSRSTAHAILEVRVEVNGVRRGARLLLGDRRPLERSGRAEGLEEDARERERVWLRCRCPGRGIVGRSDHGGRAGKDDTCGGAHVE